MKASVIILIIPSCATFKPSAVPPQGADIVIDDSCNELFGNQFNGVVEASLDDWHIAGYSRLTIVPDPNYNLRTISFYRVIQCHPGTGPAGVGSESRIDLYKDNFIGKNPVALYNVIMHELGHMFGLHHSTEENSCMTAKVSPNKWCSI